MSFNHLISAQALLVLKPQSKVSAMMEIKKNTILVILGASGDLAKKKLVRILFSEWDVKLSAG